MNSSRSQSDQGAPAAPRPSLSTPALGVPTLASEALRAGDPAVAASLRFRRPRGGMCASGYCSQCEVATPDGRALACQVAAADAPPAEAPNAWTRPLGLAAEQVPPWFYERRFLRPRRLRGLALHVLRHLIAAPGLTAGAALPPAPRTFERIEAGVVVVGSGTAAEPGALMVDEADGARVVGLYGDRELGVLRAGVLQSIRFQRLVLATGSYERLPPVRGNDLPGVVGLGAAERYAAAGALRPGLRIAVWGPVEEQWRARELAGVHGLEVVWADARPPRRILGRRKVSGVLAERRVACDLFVLGVRQPAIDLALQAGAKARLTAGELPVLVLDDMPAWLTVTGAAAAGGSGVPDVAPDPKALVCPCEDVRYKDLTDCVAQGLDQPELVKRRTGAMTGPCQGKLCSAAVLSTLRDAGLDATPTRTRPLARPVTLGELAADA